MGRASSGIYFSLTTFLKIFLTIFLKIALNNGNICLSHSKSSGKVWTRNWPIQQPKMAKMSEYNVTKVFAPTENKLHRFDLLKSWCCIAKSPRQLSLQWFGFVKQFNNIYYNILCLFYMYYIYIIFILYFICKYDVYILGSKKNHKLEIVQCDV